MKYYYTRKEVSEWLRENKILNHKEIDEVLLKVKKGKWKPKMDEDYFFITRMGELANTTNVYNSIDKWNIKTGNCFKTKQEAKEYRKKLIELGKGKMVIKGSNGADKNPCKGGAGGLVTYGAGGSGGKSPFGGGGGSACGQGETTYKAKS